MLLPGFAGCDQSQSFSSLAPFAPTASATGTTVAVPTIASSQALLASPPASPPQMSGTIALGSLFTTCRNLQALLSAPTPPAPTVLPVPVSLFPISPPQQHQEPLPPAESFPIISQQQHQQNDEASTPVRLRLRSRCVVAAPADNAPAVPAYGAELARKRIVRRSTNSSVARHAPARPPPRGHNKRRREAGNDDDDDDNTTVEAQRKGTDDGSHSSDTPSSATETHPSLFLLAPSPMRRRPSSLQGSSTDVSDAAGGSAEPPIATTTGTAPSSPPQPQTPKRARIAPAALPLGLARSDFHALHADGVPDDSSSSSRRRCQLRRGGSGDSMNTAVDEDDNNADDDAWSTAEDQMLVELVLEKLKLSKTEWQECARTLGRRDRHSLGRRWKSLMLHGEIGLRPAVGSAQGGRSSRRSRLHGTWR